MQTLLALVSFAVVTAAQSGILVRMDWSQAAERNGDLAAIRSEYIEAINARDVQRAGAVYAPDALALFGEGGVLRGAAAINDRLQKALASATGRVTLSPRRFSTAGDIGSETGTYTVTSGAAAQPAEGIYVTVYVRGPDGSWRIALEVRTGEATF